MHSKFRSISLACAAAATVALTACGTPDPYGPNNYPVSSMTPGVTYPSGAYPNMAYPNTAYPNTVYPNTAYPAGTYPAQQAGYVEFGRVINVSLISPGSTRSSGNSAAGTVIGAVAGGLLGNTIGGGSGRAAATILGAVGGAAVGNRIAGGGPGPAYATSGPVYRVSVQTDNGLHRTYDVSATGDLRPGDRVRIENGVIYLA